MDYLDLTPSGEKKSVDLHPGDAMLYLGMDGEHGRDVLRRVLYQVFLHYVRLHGPCLNTILIRIIDTEDLVKTTTTISGENKLLEYVKVYDNIFTPDECEMILDEYRDCEHWLPAGVSSNNTRILVFVTVTLYPSLHHGSSIRIDCIVT